MNKPNPYMMRRARGPMDVGRRAEEKAVRALGARPTPNSGALEGAKGDALLGGFIRAEIKSTATSVLKLDYAAARKITAEALGTKLSPALILQFVDERGETKVDGRWVAVPAGLFMEMLGCYEMVREKHERS